MADGVTQARGVTATPGMEQTGGAVPWPEAAAAPVNSSAPGVAGTVLFFGGNLYRCIATNSWVMYPGSTF